MLFAKGGGDYMPNNKYTIDQMKENSSKFQKGQKGGQVRSEDANTYEENPKYQGPYPSSSSDQTSETKDQ